MHFRFLFAFVALARILSAAGFELKGRVVDENDAPVAAARVSVRLAAGNGSGVFETQTNPDGGFTLSLPAPGNYLVNVDRQGYYALEDQPLEGQGAQQVVLRLNTVKEVFQSDNVNAPTSPLDLAQTQNEQRLSGTEVNDLPFANSHSLRNSLQLMPNVVEDQTGAIHVNGASENQVLYLLNGFNLTNPISSQLQTTLAVEGIRSVDLMTGRYSPQYGKGSAGVLAINTENGDDKFHYTATDFIPGLSIQQGLRLGNWYPRFGVSGPIKRGKAWFSDTFDAEYTESLITGLPSGQNTRSGFLGSNLLHTQVNLTPSNIVFADFLINLDNEGRVGLGPLNPVSTTSNVHTRQYFGSVKDQAYLGRGVLVEYGYAHSYFSITQSPLGSSLYIFSPGGNSGNYFVNSAQTGTRDEGLVHVYFPEFHLAGAHRLEAGVDADLLGYSGDFHRTGYEVLGLTGQLLSETVFPMPALFHTGDTDMGSYLLDAWRLSKRLQLNLGVRQDWDRRIGQIALSPRLSASWSPFASGNTRVSGGYAITHDAVPMDLFGRPLDQTALTTVYNSNGTPAGSPVTSTFTLGHSPLYLPRASNWNVGADGQFSHRIYVRANYLRRRGTDEFAFVNALAPDAPPSLLPFPNAGAAGIYQLTNLRRDDYDSAEFSVRQTFSGQFEWMVSYTRSRALTNAAIDFNFPEALQILPDNVPMPWDAPNRFVGWAYLPLPFKNWAIAVLADLRSGFPFSVRDQTGTIVGAVDSYRYPMNFDLNIAIERMITLHGYRFALRLGMDNITNQSNPTAVNNVIGAPQYLQFLGQEGRHAVVRIRFFEHGKNQ